MPVTNPLNHSLIYNTRYQIKPSALILQYIHNSGSSKWNCALGIDIENNVELG